MQVFLRKPFLTHGLIWYCGTCVRERHLWQHNLQVASKQKYPACKVLMKYTNEVYCKALCPNEDTVWSSLEYSSLGNSLWMTVKPICFPSKQKSRAAVKQMCNSHSQSSQSKCSHCLGHNNWYMYFFYFFFSLKVSIKRSLRLTGC